ncbi:MAG: prenyltransferase/squalene oxidase repeat-containing protein [Thermoguttaceae bacterium]
MDLVRETWKNEYAAATDQARQSDLAGKLIKNAEITRGGAPACFALLNEAVDLAAKAGDLRTAMRAVDEMEWRFRVHGTQTRLQAIRTIARGTGLPPSLVAEAIFAAQQAIEQNEVDAAVEFCDLAVETARKGASSELKASVDEYASRVKEYARLQKSAAKESPVGGLGAGLGMGKKWEIFGDGVGIMTRSRGRRKAVLARYGGTGQTERAVTGALIWLANHQMADGSWNLQKYTSRCKDGTCTGPGMVTADAGATAMGLLPFLAAGHTHKTKGPYRENIAAGVNWLIKHQEANGNLAKNCVQPMYSHGLATIALCEAYGMSGDRNVGMAAQGAVNYIIKAQNPNDGGWRYNPGDVGDTSVTGWQIMALKSAQLAGLSVGGSTYGSAGKWLDSCQKGPNNSLYSYQPATGHSNTMTASGLLCRQYLGAKRKDPMMTDGVKYLLDNLPDAQLPNIYYWYHGTQVLFNMGGQPWDQWNRRMRQILLDSQCRDTRTCACGSWNPAGDLWASRGGRLMMTSLAALTLEVYYRYLPLYKVDEEKAP